MAAAEVSESNPSCFLWDAGWRQGQLFRLPGVACLWNQAPQTEGPDGPLVGKRIVRQQELLLLISQDCDILSKDESRVEALLVRRKDKPGDRGYLSRISNNSFREYVLNFEQGLVADARMRFLIAKDALREIQPGPWVIDDRTRGELLDWLAGRYDRPPIPTQIHEAVCRPIRQLLEQWSADDQETFDLLNQAIREIRIRLPITVDEVLDVGLLLVLEDDIREEGAFAVERAEEEIGTAVAQSGVPCSLHIESKPYGVLLHREHEATRPLDLDYMTREGDEIVPSSTAAEISSEKSTIEATKIAEK